MKVLGISAYYHDASAALVEDGYVTAAAAEERFTRQKHDPNYPRFAIEFCLNMGGITVQDLDAVVFYEEPHVKFTRVLASALSPYPRSRSAFARSMHSWLSSKLWLRNQLSRELGVDPRRIEFVPHHVSHAAHAFLSSPFDDAAVLTIDAVGEWNCTARFEANRKQSEPVIELDTIPYPHSLGLFYSTFTAFLGFRPNDAEHSLMALAAFGEPRYADQLADILRLEVGGAYSLDPSFFEFDRFDSIPWSPRLTSLFGSPRDYRSPLPFDCAASPIDGSADPGKQFQDFADLAASVQFVLEEALLHLARDLHRRTGKNRLCLGGGCALNCAANARLLAESPFEEIYIPTDPGDGGGAQGAALYYSALHGTPAGNSPNTSPYLGAQYDATDDVAMIPHFNPMDWNPYRLAGCPPIPQGTSLQVQTIDDEEELLERTASELQSGRLVGWFQGRFECGPRALGNRSILADPSCAAAASRLSSHVKSRASFRPYALALRTEEATAILDLPNGVPHMARWMQTVAPVRDPFREALANGLHVNGTTRPQVCSQNDNPRFHRLLSHFKEATGCGALLNTSFNEGGYPMVATPADAMLVLARTELDTLVIGRHFIRKIVA